MIADFGYQITSEWQTYRSSFAIRMSSIEWKVIHGIFKCSIMRVRWWLFALLSTADDFRQRIMFHAIHALWFVTVMFWKNKSRRNRSHWLSKVECLTWVQFHSLSLTDMLQPKIVERTSSLLIPFSLGSNVCLLTYPAMTEWKNVWQLLISFSLAFCDLI